MDIVVKVETEEVDSELTDAHLAHLYEQIDVEVNVKQEPVEIKIEWEPEDPLADSVKNEASVADNVENENSVPDNTSRPVVTSAASPKYDSSERDPVRVEHVCHACSYKASQNKLLRIHQLFSCCELEHTSECGSVPWTSKSHHHRHTTSESRPSTSTDQQNINTHEDIAQEIVKKAECTKTSIAQNSDVYSCNECSYTTVWRSNLKKHTEVHTGLKPFVCDQCDYKTSWARSLASHKLTHTGYKPFSCNQCDYKASWSSSLKRHQLTHIGKKAFACDQCDFKTSWPSSLKTHKVKHTRPKKTYFHIDYNAL